MPRRDGTGPMGAGAMTGRGLGPCRGTDATRYGAGVGMRRGLFYRRGFGRGFGRNYLVNEVSARRQKELLQEEKDILQSRLEVIDKQLNSL
ncbi:MAG: DUF5320 domain-containing protein [Firmicutes bacterium]|nr:DUF5320 domain-containing protein [Bacillota bacterium]MDD4264343.1 DUF5320 domain-containing protein [Bacillota bacterium]MDD4694061.1 DUF5320 domain-containing protein [Bacillota bacterium]